mgnify:CR=1 FL=1
MTKEELRNSLHQGNLISELFEFTPGQECDIYKGKWQVSDEIIYIPDIYLNSISAFDRWVGIGLEFTNDDIEEIIANTYTGKDFTQLTGGNEELAEKLFDYVDWQHPSSALNEVLDEEGEDDDENKQSGVIDATLNKITLYMDNAIEITWIYDELASERKIAHFGNSSTRDYVKETIIDIATDFEKEYADSDWNELDYLDCLRKFAEPRLINVFGK